MRREGMRARKKEEETGRRGLCAGLWASLRCSPKRNVHSISLLGCRSLSLPVELCELALGH